MNRPNITYILGAGASSETIPVVERFAKDLSSMALTIGSKCPSNAKNLTLIDKLNWLSKESKAHVTVDTYAKKLFLNEEHAKLKDVKSTLGIYFLLKQFASIEQKQTFRKPIIHSRYIPLVSSFLQKENKKIILPHNLHFISWNYDLQLELSLEYFMSKPYDAFNYTLNHFKSWPGSMDHDSPTIVHLNGVTGLYTKVGGVLRHLVDEIHDTTFEAILEKVIPAFDFVYGEGGEKINPTLLPTFAWENNTAANDAINYAKAILSKTDYLIIIGYSFPVFNREVDKKIFQNNGIKKIYIQNPNADKTAFAVTFGVDEKKVFEVKNVDQFFIPFEA